MNEIKLNQIFLNAVSLNRAGLPKGEHGAPRVTWEDYVAVGDDILRIFDSKANSITSLTASGGCSQSNTPSATTSVTIKCNRGDITYGVLGKNLLEVKNENIVVGKYINNSGAITSSTANMYFQRFVSVKPSTAYTLATSEELNYANFMEYDANGVFLKRTLYGSSSAHVGMSVTHTMGEDTAFVIVGSNVNSAKYPEITKADVKTIKWMFNEGTTAKPYEAYRAGYTYGGEDKVIVYGKNLNYGKLANKGYTSTGNESSSATFCGNLHRFPVNEGQKYIVTWGNLPDGLSGVFINTWKADGSWNTRQAISATDSLTYTIPSGVSMVNFTLYKTGGLGIAEDSWMQIEYGTTASAYEPSVAPVASSSGLLLGVGDYSDKQDIISGTITRKVGIVILDGTENVSTSNSAYTIGISDKIKAKATLMCTHFKYSTATSSALANNTIIGFASQNVGFRNDDCSDIESFRQFLQREYAKGTPVMVVYPLAEETTEKVTPQPLTNPKGDVTIIRDAEISKLATEATMKVANM